MVIHLEQVKANDKIHGEKKSDFVDSGFVKTRDELVIGQHLHPLVPPEPVEILRRDYTITTQAATRILTQLQKEQPPPAPPPPPRPPPPLPTCPHFVVELNDIVLREGDSCELTVQVQGEPLPKITWFKDGVAVQDNNKDYLTEIIDAITGRCRSDHC